MEEQSDTPRTEMAEGQRLNPYFEGRFDGESDELCALRLTLARERDEARAIANDRDAMVDHRDRALTAMYQRVDVITQERDEARAEVERLRSAFVHCHVRGSSGDLCAACGLDLRDKVHTRRNGGEAMSIDEVIEDALFDYCKARCERECATQDRIECDLRATIEMYVAEAVAREREECAKACEDVATTRWDEYAASYNSAVFDCAAAIRTRAEKETFGAYSSKKETP